MVLSQKDLSELERKAYELISFADSLIIEGFENNHPVKQKDIRDLSTTTDIKVEDFLKKELTRILPEAGFIIEEGDSTPKEGYNWVIDPLDGTKYYAGRAPLVMTQFGLLYNNKPVLGLCSNPFTKDIFSASLGNGTKINKKHIKAVFRNKLEDAIADYDFGGVDKNIEMKLYLFSLLARNFYRVRVTAGFLHPYLITGAIDLIVTYLKDRGQKSDKFTVDYGPRFILYEELGFLKKEIVFKNMPLMFITNPALMNLLINKLDHL